MILLWIIQMIHFPPESEPSDSRFIDFIESLPVVAAVSLLSVFYFFIFPECPTASCSIYAEDEFVKPSCSHNPSLTLDFFSPPRTRRRSHVTPSEHMFTCTRLHSESVYTPARQHPCSSPQAHNPPRPHPNLLRPPPASSSSPHVCRCSA